MILTEYQTAALAATVKDLAISEPCTTGNIIVDAFKRCVPTSGTVGANYLESIGSNRSIVRELTPDHYNDGCRAWLRNVEIASRRGYTYAAAVEYAESWESAYPLQKEPSSGYDTDFDSDDFDARR